MGTCVIGVVDVAVHPFEQSGLQPILVGDTPLRAREFPIRQQMARFQAGLAWPDGRGEKRGFEGCMTGRILRIDRAWISKQKQAMSLTYKMIGGDGKEYGPISLQDLRSFIAERRVSESTQIMRSDDSAWQGASSYRELWEQPAAAAAPQAAANAPVPVSGNAQAGLQLEQRYKSGASWFYWIAALSALNSICSLTSQKWGFMVGLGVTQLSDMAALPQKTQLVAAVVDLLLIGVVALFGFFARKGHSWSFIVGMFLYALDGLIFIRFHDWLSFGFHIFVLICLFTGYRALRLHKALRRASL